MEIKKTDNVESIAAHYNLHPLNLIIISGILQVFILSVILFCQKRGDYKANKLFGILIFLSALHFSWYMILDSNLDQILGPFYLRIPFSYLLAIGPLFYFYTRTLTVRKFQFCYSDLKHFIPLSVEVLLQIALTLYSMSLHQQIYISPFFTIFKCIELLAGITSIFIYVKRSLRLVVTYERSIAENYSDHSHMTLSWLVRLMKYSTILWTFWLVFELCFIVFWYFQLHFGVVYLILYALMTITTYGTYWIGLEGLRNGGSLSDNRFAAEKMFAQPVNFYAKTDPLEKDKIVRRLTHVMENEKLFLHEALTLTLLAERLEVNPNMVSFILNQVIKRSFHDYVNDYRIDEVKRRMADPRYDHLKLIEIAYESGFNSKATFNRVFKKSVGSSPSAYIKENETKTS